MIDRNDNRYLFWLVEKTLCDTRPRIVSTHNQLLSRLYRTPFRWVKSIPMDENRLGEANRLRVMYKNETGNEPPDIAQTLLEVMIGLSIRMEHDYLSDVQECGDRSGVWFWNMVSSMGLIDYDDHNYVESDVLDILDNLLDRKYAKDGYGSLFFIPGTTRDMRRLQIWDQMLCYITYVSDKTIE